MRCSLKLLVPVIFLAAPAVALAQSPSRFNVGTPLSQQEIKSFDFMIGPDGKELPPGHGSPKDGSAVFASAAKYATGRMARGAQSGVWCWVVPATRTADRSGITKSPR